MCCLTDELSEKMQTGQYNPQTSYCIFYDYNTNEKQKEKEKKKRNTRIMYRYSYNPPADTHSASSPTKTEQARRLAANALQARAKNAEPPTPPIQA